MSTVKFSNQDKLKELQSKIYLETNISLTQQELLDLGVDILSENLSLIIERISRGRRIYDKIQAEKIMEVIMQLSSDWGINTEDSSTNIDQILYGVLSDNT
jgi:hypothetical protein